MTIASILDLFQDSRNEENEVIIVVLYLVMGRGGGRGGYGQEVAPGMAVSDPQQ